jgi:hypothetical protein
MNYSEPCENSYLLREYQYREDIAERNWLDSLPEKRDAVVEYAQTIMMGNIVQEEFDWTFATLSETDEGYERLAKVLDDWAIGEVESEDEEFLFNVAILALEGASQILWDTDLNDIASEGGFSITKMVKEVVGE